MHAIADAGRRNTSVRCWPIAGIREASNRAGSAEPFGGVAAVEWCGKVGADEPENVR
jgi:hypothetical protein